MIVPTSEKTAKIFSPLEHLRDTDRLAISIDEKHSDRFIVNIYGAAISQDEYRKNYQHYYRNHSKKNPDGTDGIIYYAMPSSSATREFPLRIPERQELYDADNYRGVKFAFAATDITVSIIYKLWMENSSIERIAFKDDLAKAKFFYLLAQSARMSENAKITSNYKVNKEKIDELKKQNADQSLIEELEKTLLPQGSENLQFCAERPLSPYQQVALYLQYVNDGFGFFMEQGTGKTPPSIANIDNLALKKYEESNGKKILKALIICPNNVRANWEKEFQHFSTVEGRVTVIRGTKMNRIKCFLEAFINLTDEKYSALICGYDIIPKMPALFEFQQFIDGDTEWDVVICDEAHYFKDPSTHRWEKGLIKLRDKSKRRYVLTGTPVCNSVNDLWTQLEFTRKGGSGFVNFKNFRDFYCVYDDYSRRVGYQNLPFIQERLAMTSFFISKKEALPDLPEKVYDIVECEMSSQQSLVYDKIATELQYKIEQELATAEGKPDAMTVSNILTQLLRLAQITSGFVTYDPVYSDDGVLIRPKRIDRFKEQPKIAQVIELLQARQLNEKTLIWACFESDIVALQEAVEAHGFKCVTFYGKTTEQQRIDAEYLFNHDDTYTVFIGNAAAGGTGLNLLGYPPQEPEKSECNVTQEIFYSQNWSAMYRAQAEDRAHRRGTRTNVRIIDLQVPNTIDTEIRNRVVEKRQSASEIADLKEILRNVLGSIKTGSLAGV